MDNIKFLGVKNEKPLCLCITDTGECKNPISDTEIGLNHFLCDEHGGTEKDSSSFQVSEKFCGTK